MHLLSLGLCLLYATRNTHAASNRTIDDEFGDAVTGALPVYGSNLDSQWNFGPACSACALKPAADKLFMKTWHDNTARPSEAPNENITLTFTGTAIWVYCALVQAGGEGYFTDTTINFNLDGNEQAPFQYVPTDSSAPLTFDYNVTVYSQTALPNTEHKLVMTVLPGSWIAFDWAQYTSEESEPPSNYSQPGMTSFMHSSSYTGAPSPSTAIGTERHSQTGSGLVSIARTIGTMTTTISGTPTTVVIVSSEATSVSPSPIDKRTPTRVIVGAAMGSAIGSLLLFLALVALCRQKGKARRSLASISDNVTTARPSKWETGFAAGVARSPLVSLSSVASLPPTSESLQSATLRTNSQVPKERRGLPHGIRDPRPHLQGQSDMSELERHALGRDSRRSRRTVSSTIGMLDTTMWVSPPSMVVEDTIYTRTPRESLVSSAVDTSEAPISLAASRPTAAGVISSLQKTIGELQTQVATLVRADEYEVSPNSSTKPPPPAYTE